MKTVLFVPGFLEDASSRNYAATTQAIEGRGYAVQFVSINWRYTTQENWVSQLNDVYSQYNSANTVLAGFSFGAVTAICSAVERQPSQVWLFSLSPLFAEYARYWSSSDRRIIGSRRLDVASKTSLSKLIVEVHCPVDVFVGEKEMLKWPEMREVYRDAINFENVNGTIVEGVGHDVTAEEYIAAIKNVV